MTLTDVEIRLLTALKAAAGSKTAGALTHMRAMGNWWSPSDLKRHRLIEQDIAFRTYHRGYARLADRGLVARQRIQGMVFYQLTDAGRAALEDVYKRETI